jgi:hypothetical protein
MLNKKNTMKKLLYFSFAALCLSVTACTKDNQGVKDQIETTLPPIEITSIGLPGQVGPFATTDAILVSFGGAATNSGVSTFEYAWYDGNTRVDSVHFKNWSDVVAAGNSKNNTISATWAPTTYSNTWTFSGSLVLQLNKLTGSGKAYTLRLYAYTDDNKVATTSVSKFITMK